MNDRIKKIVTIERLIAEEQNMHPEATGEFSKLLRDLLMAIRLISREVRRAGINDILGMAHSQNVHGEAQKRIDLYANDTIFRAMDHGGHLCCMASEESEELIHIPSQYKCGKYILLFDPLDGSSNIDVNAPIGTIFTILRRLDPSLETPGTLDDVLQQGTKIVAAGYAFYGSSTELVYTAGNGVNIFTYDPTIGEFLLTNEKVRIPERGKYYSLNEGNSYRWTEGVKKYIEHLKTPADDKSRPYSLRYIGTAIADAHRTLHYGGIFMYPGDKKNPKGKLRLLYECNPLSMIIEQAGGRATDGKQRILEIQPTEIHQTTPIFLGSTEDVLEAEKFLAEYGD